MDSIELICECLSHLKQKKPLLVAVDGIDTAGKTILADHLASRLTGSACRPVRVSLDHFLNPRSIRYRRGELSPEGYFLDSFDYGQFIQNVISPAKVNGGWIISSLESEDRIPIAADTIIIVDGVFLHRDELYSFWDFSIYLEITFETMLKRALVRDLAIFGSREEVEKRYRARYIPGQSLYIQQCHPAARASMVIDKNDISNPHLLKPFLQPTIP